MFECEILYQNFSEYFIIFFQRRRNKIMLRGSVISYDWYKSAEGQGVLAQLTDPTTGYRKLFGLLEQPSLPPSIPVHQFKLFLVGRTGSGKTCLVSWLAGLPGWSSTTGESPGVRVSQLYWPCLLAPPRPSAGSLVCRAQACHKGPVFFQPCMTCF